MKIPGFILKVLFCFQVFIACGGSQLIYAEPKSEFNNSLVVPASPCRLTLGWHSWPPFQYLGTNNQPQGLQIDIVHRLAKETNCEITFISQAFSDTQQALFSGEIDMSLDVTITEDRKKFGHFSIPYRKELSVLYVRPEKLDYCKQNNLPQMMRQGFRLSLVTGVLYGDIITEIQANESLNKLIHYQENNEIEIQELIKKNIDGILDDPVVLAYQKRKDKRIGELQSCKITLYAGNVSIMFSKKTVSPEIVERFNQAILAMRSEKEYQLFWEN